MIMTMFLLRQHIHTLITTITQTLLQLYQ